MGNFVLGEGGGRSSLRLVQTLPSHSILMLECPLFQMKNGEDVPNLTGHDCGLGLDSADNQPFARGPDYCVETLKQRRSQRAGGVWTGS